MKASSVVKGQSVSMRSETCFVYESVMSEWRIWTKPAKLSQLNN